jgi:hypothetical protein
LTESSIDGIQKSNKEVHELKDLKGKPINVGFDDDDN